MADPRALIDRPGLAPAGAKARTTHGSTGYHGGCRCDTCRAAVAAWARQRNRLRAYGRWQPWTDPGPARRHIQQLQDDGCSTRTIARLAGVSVTTVQHVLGSNGRPAATRIRPATAEAILAVNRPRLDDLRPTDRVRAIGARRRVQALAVMGWPSIRVAVHVGVSGPRLTHAITGDRITADLARRIRDTYDALVRIPPTAAGVDPPIVGKVQRRARALGWSGPGAWTRWTIDDPDAAPITGELQ